MTLRHTLVATATAAMLLAGCAGPGLSRAPTTGASALVGAWLVNASRPSGTGKNLLTFSSDGTFFRSGDSHPVLSGAHGAWRQVAPGEFAATYVAFRFDPSGKWVGSTRTGIRIQAGPTPNEFSGVARVSVRDLQDNEVGTSESRLQGRRIEVEPF